jgi:hypothetical protein
MHAHEVGSTRTRVDGKMFVALAAAPIAALLAMAAWDRHAEGPAQLVRVFVDGFSVATAASVGFAACFTGMAFALWLVFAEHMDARRMPGLQRKRWMAAPRSAMIVSGGGLLVYGSLSLLYCALTAARPDLMTEPRLPFSFAASFPCLAIGGAAYALGRFGK